MIKTCVVCGEEFGTRSRRITCGEECRRSRKATTDRRWYEVNPEKRREIESRRRLANPDRNRGDNRRWVLANLDRHRENNRRWRNGVRAVANAAIALGLVEKPKGNEEERKRARTAIARAVKELELV